MIELRDYQRKIAEAARMDLARHRGFYLAMEVRTGKTLTALEAMNYGAFRKVLFITKLKAMESIKSDYAKLEPCYTLEVVHYEAVHKVTASDFDGIIIDEAHRMGAFPKASKTQGHVKDIVERCEGVSVGLLSGTPSPESYSQLFHQFQLIPNNPWDKYKTFYKWAEVYVRVTQKFVGHGNKVNDYSDANQFLVMGDVDHYFHRYTQEAAGFDNQVKEHILTVPMQPRTYKIAEQLTKDLVVVGKEHTILADTGVKLQSKLHQIYSGTVKFECGVSTIIDRSKAEFIRKHFAGQRIAIFYKFKAEYDLLRDVFPHSTDSPEAFTADDTLTFLGQFQSAREGVNLSCADALVFYNIDFSALSYWQAKDRMSSLTRTKDNNVYWVFSEGGIEAKIHKAVEAKRSYTADYFMQDYGIDKKRFKQDEQTTLF